MNPDHNKGSRDSLGLQEDQRRDQVVEALRDEVNRLRAEVRTQATLLANLRPIRTQTVADLEARVTSLQRQFDILAAKLADQ